MTYFFPDNVIAAMQGMIVKLSVHDLVHTTLANKLTNLIINSAHMIVCQDQCSGSQRLVVGDPQSE